MSNPDGISHTLLSRLKGAKNGTAEDALISSDHGDSKSDRWMIKSHSLMGFQGFPGVEHPTTDLSRGQCLLTVVDVTRGTCGALRLFMIKWNIPRGGESCRTVL